MQLRFGCFTAYDRADTQPNLLLPHSLLLAVLQLDMAASQLALVGPGFSVLSSGSAGTALPRLSFCHPDPVRSL